MARNRGAGPLILGRTANFYANKTAEQLMSNEPDHSPYSAQEIEIIREELRKWGGAAFKEDPPALTLKAPEGGLPQATATLPYNARLERTGGHQHIEYRLAPVDLPEAPAPDATPEEWEAYRALSEEAKYSTLPAGLTLTKDGRIVGSTPYAGEYAVTVIVRDHLGNEATETLPLVVAPASTVERTSEEILAENLEAMGKPIPEDLQARLREIQEDREEENKALLHGTLPPAPPGRPAAPVVNAGANVQVNKDPAPTAAPGGSPAAPPAAGATPTKGGKAPDKPAPKISDTSE